MESEVLTVKRLCSMVLVLCLLLPCIAASASVETEERRTALSNKTLKTLLNNNGYKGWKLYQPGPREVECNTSSKSFLQKLDLYPIIAEKNGETHLILLQKRNKKWEIKLVNDKALSREGFRMYDFSMDENISSSDETCYYYFDFADENDDRYSLRLDLSNPYPSYFRFLSLPGEETENGYIYHEIVMNYDRNFTFELDFYGGSYRESINVEPWQRHEFGVEDFSLADMPLSILDLTKPATVKASSDGAMLYRYPMEQGEPIRVLYNGDAVRIVSLEYGSNNWMIVCCGNEIYFGRSELFDYE